MDIFQQIRTDANGIFPFPEDEDTVLENPPSLIWIADKQNEGKGYEVVLKDENGFVRKFSSAKSCCLLPEPLPVGKYNWNVYSGGRERGWQSFFVPEYAVEFSRPTGEEIFDAIPEKTHPRALFEKKDIKEIIATRSKELEVLKNNIQYALAQGTLRPPYQDAPTDERARRRYARDYIGTIREYADKNMIACSLGWQLLNDAAAGEMGKKLLLEISSWDFGNTLVSVFHPCDEVGLSIARTLPTAFDLLYDLLTDQEREVVVKAIAKIAEQCYQRIMAEDYEGNPGNSHVGRLPAYLGEAAMMLKGYIEKDTALKYLCAVTDIYGGIFPHYGSPDGGWGEGVFYASSYTKWYLPFFLCVERYTGKSYLSRPFYQNLSNYFLHFADKDFENHPFGDGYWCLSEDAEWPGFFAQDPFRVYAEKFGPEEAREKQRAASVPQIYKLHLMDIFLPQQMAPSKHITRPARLADAFPKTGVFSMRSSFGTENCMAVMGRASRFASASHSHADQGSFALFYEGISLISPSGYYGAGWGTKHHFEWTKQSKAHNTILVDGEGMPIFSEKPTGKIESCEQNGHLFTARLNLDNAYESLDSWERRFTMDASKGMLIVEDTVSSKQAHQLDWLLHSLGEPKVDNGTVTIIRKGIKLTIEPIIGLLPEVQIADKFETDLNAGIPEDQEKIHAPQQFHMKWKTEKAKKQKITVKFTVIRL